MYKITYKVEEDLFNFTTPAVHPFQAMYIFQEAVKVFEKAEILSLKKEDYLRIF